eukprot:397271-Prymnesium_polylepis.1
MLLAPGTLAHPIALPDSLLPELQHAALVAAGRAQAERADALLADAPMSVPALEGSPACRQWAVAMCSSRPFRMPPPHTTE